MLMISKKHQFQAEKKKTRYSKISRTQKNSFHHCKLHRKAGLSLNKCHQESWTKKEWLWSKLGEKHNIQINVDHTRVNKTKQGVKMGQG